MPMSPKSSITACCIVSYALVVNGCVSIGTHFTNKKQDLFIGTVKSASDKSGIPVSLAIGSRNAGHLFCFYEDKEGKTMRFFPNRFNENAYVNPDSVLQIPGKMPFKFTSSHNMEKTGCFLTDNNIWDQLPVALQKTDFSPLTYNISMITSVIKTITNNQYTYAEATL